MVDARNVYRKVTRKIYDFSPEQEKNLLAIVWLYRGQTEKYLDLVAGYCHRMLDEGEGCFTGQDDDDAVIEPLPTFIASLTTLQKALQPFLATLSPPESSHTEALKELDDAMPIFKDDVKRFREGVSKQNIVWQTQKTTNGGELKKAVDRLVPLAECSRDMVKQSDLLYKLASRLIDVCETECHARESNAWAGREISRARKAADEARQQATLQLKEVRYFWRQAHWLTERFPEAKLCDVEGLVKLVDRAEIEANDWSLTPTVCRRCPEEEDENFDFEETMREIHVELASLNTEAAQLAATIQKNFEELGI